MYRAVALAKVLARLMASERAEGGWTLPDGHIVRVGGQPGWEEWNDETAQMQGRGAIDLVVHALGLPSPRAALVWLQEAFPEVSAPETGAAVEAAVEAARLRQARKEELNARFERYKQVRLTEVLERLDALPNQDGDKSKWKIPGVGNIITLGQRWQNVHTEVDKGYGGVALVKHALGMESHMDALNWMVRQFGENFGEELLSDEVAAEAKTFSPPERFPEAAESVADYLVQKRGLPSELVRHLIDKGDVYGTHPWHQESGRYLTHLTRCVFLGPASAELRDTTPDGFKGCCDGSQPDSSGFSVLPSLAVADRVVALTEAAIDALSYRALFPGRFVMSTNGSGRFLLQYRIARESVDRGYGVRLALDADGPGDLAAQKVFNAFYVRKALAHHLKVPESLVDTWLTEGDLVLRVDQSPHHLFFNSGWQPSLGVHQAQRGTDEAKTVWVDTGAQAKPTIRLDVRKDLHDRLRRGEMLLTVSEAGFHFVLNTLNVRRDRPVWTKDWNDDLKRLGSAYTLDYDARSRRRFSDGVPSLPPALAALRAVGTEGEPSPEPQPPSVEASDGGRSGPRSTRPAVRR